MFTSGYKYSRKRRSCSVNIVVYNNKEFLLSSARALKELATQKPRSRILHVAEYRIQHARCSILGKRSPRSVPLQLLGCSGHNSETLIEPLTSTISASPLRPKVAQPRSRVSQQLGPRHQVPCPSPILCPPGHVRFMLSSYCLQI